jgi:superfamily I DNA and RNA helicase
MKMLVTRLGTNSRMVITGDLQQTDIQKENGLYDFITRLEKHNNSSSLIKLVKLENEDIERSEVVKKVIEIYEYKHKHNDAIIVHVKPIANDTTILKNIIVIQPENISTNKNADVNKKTNTTNTTNTMVSEIKNDKKISLDDDAAMIPKRFISKNVDIFFESFDF